ncbi:GDP-mannose 4,6-dehydratase [Cohnella terricola]|uniref:GDP-mannose 4,6-dehydratase n=1 Tax=Cohnella terricola TaxID=1289167 RepID=A0A559JB27_9BACL|nr:GDP-mannose 4,6-dehydratase [Cohnella terricola]TVX97079.1 GDP-mannose 4,6-dehydratase [Cohnella terricola]
MKALITGASGFVGTFMTRAVMNKGIDVLGVSRSTSFKNGIETGDYRCDILDKESLKEILNSYKPNYIVHLAGPAYIPDCFNRPEYTYDTIFTGTLNLLESIRELQLVTRILYVSSADIYGGATKGVLSEEDPYEPNNPYSSAKACAELLCKQYYLSYGMDILIARPFNHTGPGQSTDFVCSSFAYQVAQMKRNGKQELYTGNIDVKRDFLDVRDVVEAYLCILEKGVIGDVYNVCSGNATPIRDIVNILFQQAGIVDPIIRIDQKKIRKTDIKVRLGDNSKLTLTLNWKPKYTIEETIADLFIYWKENIHVKE